MAEGGGIGSVSVAVVPDADNFWRRFREQTQRDEPTVRVRVEADTARARAEIDRLGSTTSSSARDAQKQVHLLRDAILLLGPAAVPIGAVVGGALVGLLPSVAALGLGIAGIRDDMKSGALAGTQYAKDFHSVGVEYDKLKQISAAGLLPGIDEAIQRSQGEFAQFNRLIGTTSSQVGQIAAGAVPALIGVLNQLSPLFTTIGNDLAAGAQKFDHWAQSSDSISKFVAYVQTELPKVEHTLGELLTTVGHLTIGFAPFGGTVVRVLGLASSAINALPIDVLTKLETVLLSGYAAWRTYSGVTALINVVNAAMAKHAATAAATAAEVEAAALAEQATVAETSATEAQARADLAAEVAAAQATIAESLAGTESVLAEEAQIAADASAEEAAAFQAAADAALASSEEISAAAAAAAQALNESGAAARVGWAGLLGPLAAVAVGLALLTTAFSGSDQAAQDNQKIMDGYTQSLNQNADALSNVNIEQTAKNLKDQGAIDLMDQLNRSIPQLGLSYGSLTLAVNGTAAQFDALYTKLITVANANSQLHGANIENLMDVSHLSAAQIEGNYTMNATGKAALDLALKLKQLRGDMTAAMKIQQELNAIQRQSQIAIDGGASATARQARALHLTADAYLNAQIAAKKNTDQTAAQTAAFQAEGDSASLLQQALDGLAGVNLSLATARTALASSSLQVAAAFKQSKSATLGDSAAGVANRQALQGQVQTAQQLAKVIGDADRKRGQAAKGERDEVASLNASKVALEAVLKAHGDLTPKVQAYIDKLYSVKQVSDYLNKHPVVPKADPKPAEAAARAVHDKWVEAASKIAALRPEMDVINQPALSKIIDIENHWNALHDKTIHLGVVTIGGRSAGISPSALADGGTVTGRGGPKSDSVPALLSPGEEVIQEPYASQHRALLKAINAGAQLFRFAAGGTAGSAGTITAAQLKSLRGTVSGADAKAYAQSLTGSIYDVGHAFTTMLADAQKAGLSDSLAAVLKKEDAALQVEVKTRNDVARQLKAANTNLAAVQQKYHDEVAAVQQATSASIDITSIGQNAAGLSSFGSILAAAKQQETIVKQYTAGLRKLAAEGLGKTSLRQLAEAGPSALPQVLALEHATPKQLAQLNAVRADIAGQAAGIGKFVGKLDFGKTLASDKELVASLKARDDSLNGAIGDLGTKIERQIEKAIGAEQTRPVQLVLSNGQLLAKFVQSETKKLNRR